MTIRTLAITGSHNLRDLGGYQAADGRRVKWRMLYRAGAIYGLTPEARAEMHALGITAICDLRTPQERDHRPMDWHEGAEIHYYGGLPLDSGASLERLAVSGGALQANMREHMQHIYRNLPFEQAGSYRHLFTQLAAGRVPLLFNCSAGKDRTGLAAALLLSTLGIPYATIIEDYLLSNAHIDGLRVIMMEQNRGFAALAAWDPDAFLPVLVADSSYLDLAFAEIEQRHGSTAAYLTEHLGVTPDIQARLRALLLE